jgi:hypothetical protein
MGPGMMQSTGQEPGRGVELAGGPPATLPDEQDIWTESAEGTGRLTLDWTPQEGNWSLVVMRADGGPDVAASLRLGATAPALPWVAGGLLVLGGLLLVAGAVTVLLAVRSAGRATGEEQGPDGPPAPTGPPAEPVLVAPR